MNKTFISTACHVHCIFTKKSIFLAVVQLSIRYSIPFYPITLVGHLFTTDGFATIPFHLVLFTTALVELASTASVHCQLPTSSSVCLFFFFLLLCPVGMSLLNQRTLRRFQTILVSISCPASGAHHILQWLLGSFCEPAHW